MIKKELEKIYIELYDKIGCKEFCIGNDEQLKEWGNSASRIKKIKINAIKEQLKWYETGIKLYKQLNELCGGKNAI